MKIQNQLGYIKGITFAPFHKRGSLSTQTARDSFDYMIEHTAADFVILAPVDYRSTHTQKRFVTLPVPHSQMKN